MRARWLPIHVLLAAPYQSAFRATGFATTPTLPKAATTAAAARTPTAVTKPITAVTNIELYRITRAPHDVSGVAG